MTTLAFIVNAFENPAELRCCLASLQLQWQSATYKIEIHVADNSKKIRPRLNKIELLCEELGAFYHITEGHCYTASEYVANFINGRADYLCFASSDGYYVPGFSSIMLETAMRTNADLVYCNVLYDPRLHGRGIYSVLDSFPELRWIDKTNFIVKASCFRGWPTHPQMWCDGQFVENLVASGGKIAKAKGILVVHN